jgi:hypothetical protein
MNIKVMLIFALLGLMGATLLFMEIQRFYTQDVLDLVVYLVMYTVAVNIFTDAVMSITSTIRLRKLKKQYDADRAFRKLGGE